VTPHVLEKSVTAAFSIRLALIGPMPTALWQCINIAWTKQREGWKFIPRSTNSDAGTQLQSKLRFITRWDPQKYIDRVQVQVSWLTSVRDH
jgi:uncharacterized protein YhdP